MGKLRSINKIVGAQKVNMGGIILDQAIPLRGIDKIDPFLLIHHWSDKMPGGKKQQDVGVGPHPHRGFAPVTFIFKGGVHHRDSSGHQGVVYEGGTQWMNSGKGVVHSERPTKELAEKGGDFELIQFWVNVPAKYKMNNPNYQPLPSEDTPWVKSKDGKVNVGVVAGNYEGQRGPVKTLSKLLILRLQLEEGGEVEVDIPPNYNALTYQLDGKLTVQGEQETSMKTLHWYNDDGDAIKLKASAATRVILLSGEPINEPVATHGPFVMNTDEEIQQAMYDYQSGQMGFLTENFD